MLILIHKHMLMESRCMVPAERGRPTMKRRIALFLCTFVIGLFSSSARAEEVEKQVAKMNKRAMDDYDALEFESSRRTLIDAVEKLRANGFDDTPLAAKTYLNLGIVYI